MAPRERGDPFAESVAAEKTLSLETVAPRERGEPFVESVAARE